MNFPPVTAKNIEVMGQWLIRNSDGINVQQHIYKKEIFII